MIRRVVRFVAAGRVTQMVRQLPAERPFDDGFLDRRTAASSSSGEIGPWRTN